MTLPARYADTDATLVRFAGETLTFEGEKALAPGTPVTLAVLRAESAPLLLEGRALGSRKPTAEATRFVIQVRLVNLRKPDREWLTRSL